MTTRSDSVVTLVPDPDDVDENEEILQPFADAQLVALDEIAGYERIGLPGEITYQSAPAQEGYKFDPDAGIKTFREIPKVTEETAREVLIQQASQRCCYSTSFIQDMPITKVETTLAWHYTLESFLESRSTCWIFEPYEDGAFVDGPQNGRPPGPWEVALKPREKFKDGESESRVPHSSQVKPCHHCFQHGQIQCYRCKGKKLLKCAHCDGQGKKNATQGGVQLRVACNSCEGKGKKKCSTCSGKGDVVCPTCKGNRNLIFSIKIKCEWITKETDFIEEKTDLPDELVRDVTGKTIFSEEDEHVIPIQNFSLKTVNEASKKLIHAHEKNFPNSKRVRQRHQLRAVPVTECHYQHDNKRGMFFVYGFENKLWIEKFPESSCCDIL